MDMKDRSAEKILFVISGESNSGGYALNTEAPGHELGIRSSVKILNNTHLSSFDDLDIGKNNLVGHTGLPNGVTHGFELELANRAVASPVYNEPCFLVKTGQGGSRIAEWNTQGMFFKTFVKRSCAAKKLLEGLSYRTAVLFSLGINDALAGTDGGVWKSAVISHLADIREVLGRDTPVIMTKFMPYYPEYNRMIGEIAEEVGNTYSVYTEDASLRDEHHWDHAGMKLVAGRMLDIFESL
jgi:hypothetical protein